MLRALFTLLFFSVFLFSQKSFAVALDEFTNTKEQDLKITGFIDLQYVYNFNTPPPVAQPTATNLTQPAGNNGTRAFDLYHNDFNLSLAELLFTKKKDDVTFKLAINVGRATEVISPRDEVTKHFSQATITYNPAPLSNLSITAGKMISHIGREVFRSIDNWNYSRSTLFNFSPYWHEGIGINYHFIPDVLSATFFAYNNMVGLYEDNKNKALGAQINYAPIKDMRLSYNFLGGPDGVTNNRTRLIHNLYGIYDLNPNFSLSFDSVYGEEKNALGEGRSGTWLIYNLSFKWKFNEMFISPRFTYFDDSNALNIDRGVTEQIVSAYTITYGIDLGGGLNTWIEWRKDSSNKNFFAKGDGTFSQTQDTFAFAFLYTF